MVSRGRNFKIFKNFNAEDVKISKLMLKKSELKKSEENIPDEKSKLYIKYIILKFLKLPNKPYFKPSNFRSSMQFKQTIFWLLASESKVEGESRAESWDQKSSSKFQTDINLVGVQRISHQSETVGLHVCFCDIRLERSVMFISALNKY